MQSEQVVPARMCDKKCLPDSIPPKGLVGPQRNKSVGRAMPAWSLSV